MSASLRFGLAVLASNSLLILAPITGCSTVDSIAESEPLVETAGRVQLVIDEQDVGLVPQGMPLEVEFTVANTGAEELVLRQAPHDGSSPESLCGDFIIRPGRTSEVLARLLADDLIGRGRKHIRFFTSDPTTPELWLTVRGSVVRHTALRNDEAPLEHSVLVK